MEQKIEKPEPLKGFWVWLSMANFRVMQEITSNSKSILDKSHYKDITKNPITSHIDFENAEIWRVGKKMKFIVLSEDRIILIKSKFFLINEVKEIKYSDIHAVDFKLQPFNKEKTERLQIIINYRNKNYTFGINNSDYNIKFAQYLKQRVENKQLSVEKEA